MNDGKPVEDCVFCKIVAGMIPAAVVRETEDTLAFQDISAQAPKHLLVVPKAHYANAVELATANPALAAALLVAAAEAAEADGFADTGYRMVFNSGTHALQTVFHVHCHVLGGDYLSTFGT